MVSFFMVDNIEIHSKQRRVGSTTSARRAEERRCRKANVTQR